MNDKCKKIGLGWAIAAVWVGGFFLGAHQLGYTSELPDPTEPQPLAEVVESVEMVGTETDEGATSTVCDVYVQEAADQGLLSRLEAKAKTWGCDNLNIFVPTETTED